MRNRAEPLFFYQTDVYRTCLNEPSFFSSGYTCAFCIRTYRHRFVRPALHSLKVLGLQPALAVFRAFQVRLLLKKPLRMLRLLVRRAIHSTIHFFVDNDLTLVDVSICTHQLPLLIVELRARGWRRQSSLPSTIQQRSLPGIQH